jgi:hypothetical protein
MLGLAAVVLGASSGLAQAQTSVTTSDIQRLQESADLASADLAQVRARDTALADRLAADLADARDEIIYLKVKLRKGEPLARREYSELRDRLDDIRDRAADVVTPPPAVTSTAPTASGWMVPVGTEMDLRLQSTLSSATAQVEDRFEATTIVDLRRDDRVLIPAGSVVRGIVSAVDRAGRLDRKGSLTVIFDEITIRGRHYPIRATVTQAIESEGYRGDAGRIGAGASVGAIIGGLLGGVRGALAGILIGGGGTIAATEGKDVELRPGTVLRVRLDSGLDVAPTP